MSRIVYVDGQYVDETEAKVSVESNPDSHGRSSGCSKKDSEPTDPGCSSGKMSARFSTRRTPKAWQAGLNHFATSATKKFKLSFFGVQMSPSPSFALAGSPC